MDPIFQNDVDEVWGPNGQLLSSTPRQRDVTAQAVELDLHTKVRAAINANKAMQDDVATFLAIANPSNLQILQAVRRLASFADTTAKENTAVIRLLVRGDLLLDNAGT